MTCKNPYAIFTTLWLSLLPAFSLFAQLEIPEDLEVQLLHTDSLGGHLLADYHDTTKVRLLNQLFEKYQPNRPEKAIDFALLALEISERTGYSEGLANSLNSVGVFNKNRGNFDKALERYLKALHIFREEGNIRGEAKTLSNMGNIYSSLGQPRQALEFFLQADSIFSLSQDTTSLIGLYNNLGNAYLSLGDDQAGFKYYFRALELYNQLNAQSRNETSFNPYTNIGQVYFARRQFDSALYYYQRSLIIERNQNRMDGQALALNNIGVIYQRLENTDKALEFHGLALDIAQRIDDKQALKNIYQGLVDAHFARQDVMLAYYYLDQVSRIKDSLYLEESDRMLAMVEMNRELDQKESEIRLLRQENEIKDLRIELNRTTTILLILVVLMALGGVALLYLRYQQNRKVTVTLEHQNRQIQEQNRLIEDKNHSITESIEYARSLQDAVVNRQLVSDCFAEAFVFYRPKDIVSGDFYFYAKAQGYEMLAVADCTGHGVAGAFMTVIGNAILNQIILEHKETEPARILQQLNRQLGEMLRLKQEEEASGRGMDIAICRIDPRHREVTFAGAKRPLLFFQNGEMKQLKGSRSSIGDGQESSHFESVTIPYRAGDTFYMYSDGYADQFGGRQNKKYLRTRFRTFLQNLQKDSLDTQLTKLGEEIDTWRGPYEEQTDDMLVVGFRF